MFHTLWKILPSLCKLYKIWSPDSHKMLDFKAKNAPNSILAGTTPQNQLRELTAVPRPPSWIKGGLLLREREGKSGQGGIQEGEGKGGRGRKGREGKGKGRGEGKGPKGWLTAPMFQIRENTLVARWIHRRMCCSSASTVYWLLVVGGSGRHREN